MTVWHVQPRVTMNVLPVLAALIALSCGPRDGQQFSSPESQAVHFDAHERKTLAGLAGVFVVLDGVSSDVETLGLRQSGLLQEIQDQLRNGGVRVLTREEARDSPGSPYLYVNVNVVKGSGDYAYSVRVELNQGVRLERASNVRTMAATWQPSAVLATVGAAEFVNAVRQDAWAQVAKFVDDYRSSN